MPSGIYNHQPCKEETKIKIRLAKIGKGNPKIKNIPKSEEHRRKLSESEKGKFVPKEVGRKISENKERALKISISSKGKPKSLEHRRNLGLSQLGNTNKKGKKASKDTLIKQSLTQTRLWQDENYREKQIKAILNGLFKRPTSYEQKISDLCIKYNLPFVYKGNGDFLINFKNPDFVNELEKIVIEVFFSYYKIRDYGSVESYKLFCKNKYEPLGWKVIFIDELDLNSKEWEMVCLNKIKEGLKN